MFIYVINVIRLYHFTLIHVLNFSYAIEKAGKMAMIMKSGVSEPQLTENYAFSHII